MSKFNLDNHPKISCGLNAPPDYFNNLSEKIEEKIKEEQPNRTRVFTLKRLSLAVAAILVLALCIPFFMDNSAVSEERIDTTSLENYLAYQSGVSSYDLITLMDVTDLDAMQVDLALEDESVEDILTSNPNFENYLID
jgi:hypothetical protein